MLSCSSRSAMVSSALACLCFGASAQAQSDVGSLCGSPEAALLSTIAYSEGTNDDYRVLFGNEIFEDFASHPRKAVCVGRICSSAAGRYLILSETWDSIQSRLNLPDFSPASQDQAALFLIEKRGVNANEQLDAEAFSRAIAKLGREWASLPGSPFAQPARSMEELFQKYNERLTCN